MVAQAHTGRRTSPTRRMWPQEIRLWLRMFLGLSDLFTEWFPEPVDERLISCRPPKIGKSLSVTLLARPVAKFHNSQ